MPTYEYRCKDCQKCFAVTAKMSDPAPTAGPGCSSSDCSIEKTMSRVAGWVKGKGGTPTLSMMAGTASRTAVIGPATPSVDARPELSAADDTIHLCSQYCEHHPKV